MIRLSLALVLGLTSLPALAEVPLGGDGLHKPDWLKNSFKVLAEDSQEATDAGRALMLMVEQRGCIYCAKLHNEVLTDPRIDSFIRGNLDVVQLDLFGGTEVTDLDGEVLTEKRAAQKWGVTVTPTLIFLPANPPAETDVAGAAMAVIPGVLTPDQLLAVMEWAKAGGPDTGKTVQDVLER